MPTRIKICGVSRVESAEVAVASGAHAIGLMCYAKSARYVTPKQAGVVAKSAPQVLAVAVFVNPEVRAVHEVLQHALINELQFHGDESPEFCRRFKIPYVKTLRVASQSDAAIRRLEKLHADDNEFFQGLLLDTYVAGEYGGTGESFAWSRAQFGGDKPVILAGGLTAENVAAAIACATPAGVDVSSGVETAGEKDAEKIRAFCDAVRLAEQSPNND